MGLVLSLEVVGLIGRGTYFSWKFWALKKLDLTPQLQGSILLAQYRRYCQYHIGPPPVQSQNEFFM
jgi:hypothetical protein